MTSPEHAQPTDEAPAASTWALAASVPLPATIGVVPEVLGSITPTTIGDVIVGVHLPQAREGEHHLFRPAVLDWQPPEPEYATYNRDPDDRPDSPWGHTITDGPNPVFGVTRVVVVVVDQLDESSAKPGLAALIEGFASWFDRAKDWCEVLTLQDLDYLAPRRLLTIEGDGWDAWWAQQDLEHSGRLMFDFDYGEAVSLERWSRICELAGSGTSPATEHLLLRDSRAAVRRKNYRRSVIDAATAMEIALHSLLLAEHRANPSSLADQLLELAERWTLGTMIANVGKFRDLPPGVNTNAVELRNKVVHRSAYTPSMTEAESWLALATSVVDLANPMPDVP